MADLHALLFERERARESGCRECWKRKVVEGDEECRAVLERSGLELCCRKVDEKGDAIREEVRGFGSEPRNLGREGAQIFASPAPPPSLCPCAASFRFSNQHQSVQFIVLHVITTE